MATTDDERERLLDKLTPEARAALLTGASTWRTRAEPAIGLREVVMSDGPAGVRGESWDERDTSALLPSPSALAATWDEDLVAELGGLLAAEARRKGVDVLLAPALNLHRSPLAGRHFECFSEDPLLTGRIGAALIRGVQAHGIAATAKHYVANDSETDRLTVDVRVGARALREVYLAPFEAAVAAGVRVVMAAYNGVNGASMAASPLLTEPLKGEWGFTGVVVSDWGAVTSTADTARAGLDLVMPGPSEVWGAALARAVAAGEVPPEAVDDKVRRLLRLAGWTGALGPRPTATALQHRPDEGELLRSSAAAGAVLLADRGLLPLDPDRLGTVAVIGAHAAATRTAGGGSSAVFPHEEVSVLDGLRAALAGRARIVHAPGPAPAGPPPPLAPGLCADPRTGAPGLLLRVLDPSGAELHAEHRLSGRQLEPPCGLDAHTVEISALLRPTVTGEWTLGIGGFGRLTLVLDGRTLLDEDAPRHTDDPAVVHVNPPVRTVTARLEADRPALLVTRRTLAPDTGRAVVVTAAPPADDPAAAIREAARAAARADVAVVVVGTTAHDESEGADRTCLALGPQQDALVRAVAAANPRTAAVVNSGGPVELPWRDDVAAVLLAWFPGQQGGAGVADVLVGRREPGGRLPTTWPAALTDAPVTDTVPRDGRLRYDEGLHVGHRGWLRDGRAPAYWFGHGLGYTTWEYEELTAPGDVPAGAPFTVRVRVRNTGGRTGREVVQVYLARPGADVEYPVRWLAGYAAVRADPGRTATAAVTVPAEALRHWCEGYGWRVEPGACSVLAGRCAGELPLRAEVRVLPPG
ncbi:glycoside hydrolase family 3 C-terminal domain-containing protein [Streptomyces sp. NPDC101249]|uniref:glycoside hydrolase family 3 C-terminal domain-containing protein n=1 Tax=Streptomyces sp. NPDC101249 TaxID=3366140 RepID=UPI003804BE41